MRRAASADAEPRKPPVPATISEPDERVRRARVAQPTGTGKRIGLVGCVKSKRSSSAPARDLYTSTLFHGRRGYVEATGDPGFVLSALHGVVDPEERLSPYDESLTTASTSARRQWSQRVLRQLRERLGDLSLYAFELHAGQTYCDYGLVAGLEDAGAIVERPAAGLSQGRQLAFYAKDPSEFSAQ